MLLKKQVIKNNAMIEILYSYGYTLDRSDVANGGNVYEDWWVR